MRNYEILSGYTLNTPYENEIKFLIESLKKFNFSCDHIVPYKNQGTWEKNCQYKAIIIKEKLKELKKPVVWLDADAVIVKNPILFENIKEDMASCQWYGGLISGTLYFKNNEKINEVINEWIELNEQNPKEWDQKTLTRVAKNKEISIKILPLSYCKIDYFKTKNAFIMQNQASRRFKRIINNAGINGKKST
jgi:hypothetical protein